MDPKPGMDDHRFNFFRSLAAAASGDGDGAELLSAVCDVLLVFVDEPVVLGVL
jgi:hypothetical protein